MSENNPFDLNLEDAEPVEMSDGSGRGAESTESVGASFIEALAGAAIERAISAAVKKRVNAVAQEAVSTALTDEVIAALKDKAAAMAESVVTAQLEEEAPGELEEEEPPPPQLYYGSVIEFFADFLRKVYRREISGRAAPWWREDWWADIEALTRIEALWRAWEALRLDPATGISVWLRDHADYHLERLMSESGPFMGSRTTNERGSSLPHIEPPEGLFPDQRTD